MVSMNGSVSECLSSRGLQHPFRKRMAEDAIVGQCILRQLGKGCINKWKMLCFTFSTTELSNVGRLWSLVHHRQPKMKSGTRSSTV